MRYCNIVTEGYRKVWLSKECAILSLLLKNIEKFGYGKFGYRYCNIVTMYHREIVLLYQASDKLVHKDMLEKYVFCNSI